MTPGFTIFIYLIGTGGWVEQTPLDEIECSASYDAVERRIAKWAEDTGPEQGRYLATFEDGGRPRSYAFTIQHTLKAYVEV